MKVHTSAKYWLFTTTNVAQRALVIIIELQGWYSPLKKFIVVYKTVGYCTNIYIYMLIRKEPCPDKLTPSLNIGRWDLDAPVPGLWENIIFDIYIYKYTCTKIRLFLSILIHLNTKYICRIAGDGSKIISTIKFNDFI